VALVLCTGIDPVLLETRRLILQRAGHTVIIARNVADVARACEEHHFDVAVLGQAITPNLKKSLASLIREQCPSAKILELYSTYQGKTLDAADSWLEVPADIPQQLAARVNQLAETKSKDTEA